jgi:NADPH-dependent glutamate synthase beta subunit-like oxidoreductase
LIAWGRYEEALQIVRKVNPFPSVCGRICQHACEAKCRRGALDAPIALKELKRFVTEVQAGSDWRPPVAPATRGKVAVVGAGPSGLTTAQDLRDMGYAVTVLERLPQPGGMLNLIPKYRLPEYVVRRDITTILARGIALRCNCEIGRDVQLSDLKAEGFQAVVVCAGLSRSRGLALPGFGAERFIGAIPLMMDVWAGNPVEVGRKALVIGGGNVAADVARTLRRLGAQEVTMACVESRAEMPATEEEISGAVEEGVRLMPSWGPKRVLKKDGRVAGFEMMRVLSVFDEQKRFNPKYDPAHVKVVTADMIVLTIGQAGDTSWTRGSGVKLDRRGRVAADREMGTTSEPGVFLAGEVLRGPGSAIEAIADGHRAAALADQFLRTGAVKAAPAEVLPVVGEFPKAAQDQLRRMDRVPAPLLPRAERMQGFHEHELGYDEAAALQEAGRCLNCGAGPVIDEEKCAFCLTCFRLCSVGGIEIGKKMVTAPQACQACGLCAAECPQGAITLGHWPNSELHAELMQALKGALGAPATSAVVQCIHSAASRGDLAARPASADGVVHLGVPCITHFTAADLMLLIANGVQTVQVMLCAPSVCKHANGQERVKQVLSAAVQRARAVRPKAEIRFVEIQPTPSPKTPLQGVTA